MRALYSSDGSIPVYDYNPGSPYLRAGRFFIPLVVWGDAMASKLRVLQGYALTLAAMIDLKRVLVAPYVDGDEIVFPRYDGTEMFRLKIAGVD